MFFQGLRQKVIRARQPSNMMFSAAAIAVVSEVIPDKPGAFFFPSLQHNSILSLLFFSFLFSPLVFSFIIPNAEANNTLTQRALASPNYNHTLLQVTPMLFHRIELGMTYEAVVNTVGKSALYCDSGQSTCTAENGSISKSCLDSEFIQTNKTWLCHWDGVHSNHSIPQSLDLWFVGARLSQVVATMPDGDIYRRDSGNTIYLERHEVN